MFTVGWHDEAAEEAQRLVFTSDAVMRLEISDSIQEIERALALIPLDIGESREQNDRIAFLGCLGVIYSVDEATEEVFIWDVWLNRRSSSK